MQKQLSNLIRKSFSIEAKSMPKYTMPHPIWNKPEVESVSLDHKPAVTFGDHFAYAFI